MATLKAGTYILKAVPTVANPAVYQRFSYKTYTLTANNTYDANPQSWTTISSGYSSDDTGKIAIVQMTDQKLDATSFFRKSYETERDWYYWYQQDDYVEYRYTATDTTKLRTIIVETEQTVDDAFYTWFMANIEKPRLSVDLTTLSGWASLSAGSHNIQIVAKASGYKDSAPSAAVKVTKAASTKTLAAGTYKWIAAPQFNAAVNYMQQALDFTVSASTAAKIVYDIDNHVIQYFDSADEFVGGYNGNINKWINNMESEDVAYQTITLAADQQVSAEFYDWAITGGNLVKLAVDNGITTDTPTVSYSDVTFTPVSSSTSSQSQLVKQKVDAAINNGSNLQTALNSISPDIWTTLTEDFTSEFLNSNVRIRDIGDFLFTDTDITRLIINCEAKVYFFVMYYGESWLPTAAFTNTIDLPSSIAEEGNAVAGFIMLSQVPRS